MSNTPAHHRALRPRWRSCSIRGRRVPELDPQPHDPEPVPDLRDHGARREHPVGLCRPVQCRHHGVSQHSAASPAVLVSMPPVPGAWSKPAASASAWRCWRWSARSASPSSCARAYTTGSDAHARDRSPSRSHRLFRHPRRFFDPAVAAIESFDAARTGYLGGLGLPIVFSWLVGGVFAAAAAWLVGKIALGLRADYLAIATLGISEIVIAVMRNEEWLTRGVKNVSGLPRPVAYEVQLQQAPWFLDLCHASSASNPTFVLGHLRPPLLRDPLRRRAHCPHVAGREARSTRPGAA
jgi:hypothetical protein